MANTLYEVHETAKQVSKAVDKIDTPECMVMILGVVIDQWTADHDLTPEESREMVEMLAEAHKMVNEMLGTMPKSLHR